MADTIAGTVLQDVGLTPHDIAESPTVRQPHPEFPQDSIVPTGMQHPEFPGDTIQPSGGIPHPEFPQDTVVPYSPPATADVEHTPAVKTFSQNISDAAASLDRTNPIAIKAHQDAEAKKAADAQDAATYQHNLSLAGQYSYQNSTATQKNWAMRTALRTGDAIMQGTAGTLAEAGSQLGVQKATDIKDRIAGQVIGDAAFQAEADKQSGPVGAVASQATAGLGEAFTAMGMPGGFLTYMTAKSGAQHLEQANQQGITGQAAYTYAGEHAAIDAASIYLGGKVLGAPLETLAGVGQAGGDEAAQKAIEFVTERNNLSKAMDFAIETGKGGTSQALLGASTTAAHYLANVDDAHPYDAKELEKKMLDELPVNIATGVGATWVHQTVDALTQRQTNLPGALNGAQGAMDFLGVPKETLEESRQPLPEGTPPFQTERTPEDIKAVLDATNQKTFADATGIKNASTEYRGAYQYVLRAHEEVNAPTPAPEESAATGEGMPEPPAAEPLNPIQRAVEAVKKVANTEIPTDGLEKLFSPATRDDSAALTAQARIHRMGENDQSRTATREALKTHAAAFDDLQTPQEQLQFQMDRDEGKPLAEDSPFKPFWDKAKAMLDRKVQQVRDLGTGKLQQVYENYFPRLYKKKGGTEPLPEGPQQGNYGGFTKPRSFETLDEAVAAGYEPVTTNPADMVMMKIAQIDKYLMEERFKQDLKDNGIRKYVAVGETPPEGWIKQPGFGNDELMKGAHGLPVIAGSYYVPEPAAKVINNYLDAGLGGDPLYQAYRGVGNNLVLAELAWPAFHAKFTSIAGLTSSAALGLKYLADGKPISALIQFAKTATGPLEVGRLLYRGNQAVKAYRTELDLIKDTWLRANAEAAVRAGARIGFDPAQKTNWRNAFAKMREENFSDLSLKEKLASPFVPFGAALEYVASPLTEWWVPRMKFGMQMDMARYEVSRLGRNATDSEAMAAFQNSWRSIDNRMGQIVWDNRFWNKTVKDLGMASTTSLGWQLGAVEELLGSVTDLASTKRRVAEGQPWLTHKMAFAVSMPFVAGLYGATVQYLHTGQWPEKLWDYFHPKSGRQNPDGTDERYNVPSYMTDVTNSYYHPLTTVENKMHPLLRSISEMLNNADYYGTEIRNKDDSRVQQLGSEVEFMAKKFVPYSLASAQKERASGGTGLDSAISGLNIAPASQNRSPAMDKAVGYIRDSAAPVKTKEQAEASAEQYNMRMEFKKGNTKPIEDALDAGKITAKQARALTDKAEKSPLVNAMAKLTIDQSLNVYELADPKEREDIKPLVISRYIRDTRRMPPDQIDSVQQKATKLGLFEE